MEGELRTLLYDAVVAFATAQQMRVAWPNVAFDNNVQASGDAEVFPMTFPISFESSAGTRDEYMRASLLPVPPDVRGVTNGWSVYQWLLQVSVYIRDGLGELKSMERIDALRVAFPFNRRFVGAVREYQIMEPASIAPPVPIDGWLSTPATIRVQTIA